MRDVYLQNNGAIFVERMHVEVRAGRKEQQVRQMSITRERVPGSCMSNYQNGMTSYLLLRRPTALLKQLTAIRLHEIAHDFLHRLSVLAHAHIPGDHGRYHQPMSPL